jgi:hypothetical protein
MKKLISICCLAIFSSNVFALSLDDKLSAWRSASYSEQAKMCESIANALKKPNVTAPDLCIYLSEMSSGGEAEFMKISQLAALYATVAK